jgi:hypothetical protein
VDGLACPLHRPMSCSHQMWGHDFMSDTALSHRAAADGGTFSRDAKPWAWIFARVLTIWVPMSLSFYMGHVVFTSVFLPCGRVLVVCMRVSLVKFKPQPLNGQGLMMG